MTSKTKYRLFATLGPEAGRVIDLSQDELTIGRAPDAQLVLDSPRVSRYHARIRFQAGGFFIEDNNSANGTFLNGERIQSPQALSPGDLIQFAEKYVFEYQEIPSEPVRKDTIGLAGGNFLEIENDQINPKETRVLEPAGPITTRADAEVLTVSEEASPPKLMVTIAGEVPKTHLLVAPAITIGRDADNEIVIDSKIISRQHAMLEKIERGYRLSVNPDNTNETYVNGQMLLGELDLAPNSLIRVGSAEAGQLVTIQYLSGVTSDLQKARNIQLGKQARLTFGRDSGNDIVLEAPAVSRFHAEIERVGQRYRITDLHSLNGTFLNDVRVEREAWAKPQDTVRIGPHLFVLGEEVLAQIDQTGGLHVDVVGLQKWVRKDLNLLQDISLVLKPSEFVVVVGQSGGGKTTLVDAVAGYRPATQGQVYINDTNLYRHFEALRANIGYVPQRDIIHTELTVYESLDYSAKLRMPPDTSPEERHTRIIQVLDELDLKQRKDVQISKLSGGQQKRVSIGVELLTKPGLFFLDEPTSGLDPGTETSLMQLMRRLADQGRTIVLITHATKNVMLADKVIFLARGGYLAWFGPPDEALKYFAQYQSDRERRYGGMDFDQIYAVLEDPSHGSPEDWHIRFRAHNAFRQYVAEPLQKRGHQFDLSASSVQKSHAPVNPRTQRMHRGFDPLASIRQLAILSARNLKILSRDRISLLLMLAAAPLVGLLDFVLASGMDSNPFDYQTGDFSPIAISLFLFTIYGVLVGGLSQMREIVKESAVYRRERLVNLQILPYVLSKMWVAGLLALYHALAYTILHYLAFDMPGGFVEFVLIYITVVLATYAGMMLGLFASALAPNSNTVPLLVILLMIPQIVLAGALIPLPNAVTSITSTRWAFQSLMGITGVGSDLAADPCWDMSIDDRFAMSLEQKKDLGCLCLGTNALRRESCEFPGLGELYDPAIDAPEPAKPAEVGDPPARPQIPDPPPEPLNPNDPLAMNAYLQALKAHQEHVAQIQSEYERQVETYQQQVRQYQDQLIAYQESLADWQIRRNEAVAQAEGMLARFEHLFGWSTVDKGSAAAFGAMLLGTWAAQGMIITTLFGLILLLMKLKDRSA